MGRKSSYTYTMRGQSKRTDTPGFVQTLYYEDGQKPCFNGNISAASFGYEFDAASGSVWETDIVDYHYDPLNRLVASISSDGYRRFYRYAMGMFR